MPRRAGLTGLAVLVAGLGACAPASRGAAPLAELLETRWRLVRLGAESIATGDRRQDPYVRLQRDGGRVEGFAGCNRMTGGYTIAGDALAFGPLASTRMACAGSAMTLERGLFEALGATAGYVIRGTRLTVRDASGTPLAEFEPWLPR